MMDWIAENYGLLIFIGIIVGFALFGGLGTKKKSPKVGKPGESHPTDGSKG